MRFRFLSILIVTVVSGLLTQSNLWADEAYFIESGGIVSMEAENYTSNSGYVFMNSNTINTGAQVAQCPGYPNRPAAGFSGKGYMARNKVGQSISYRIKFTTTGQYYVNMRTWSDTEALGGSCYNGYCLKWNGVEVVSGCPANGVYVTKRAEWQWDTEISIGETRQGAVIVNVRAPGFYTLTVYPKKEWYTWHDKIVLRHTSLCTNNPCPRTVTFDCYGCNTGTGVPESQRSTDPTPSAPTATTSAATSVTSDSATLNGTVNPNDASTAVVFDYGTTTSYGTTVSATQSPLTGTTSQAVSAQVSGLITGEIYHFRVRATNSGGTGTGSDLTFTAARPVPAPTAMTGEATSVSSDSATLNGTVNPYDASTAVVFDYGTTTNYGSVANAAQSPLSGSKTQTVSTQIKGLSADTTYYFRVRATNSGGTGNGNDHTFVTIGTTSVIRDMTFTAGSVYRYTASTSITFGPGVTIKSGATVVLTAPIVNGVNDITVEEGANLTIKTSQ